MRLETFFEKIKGALRSPLCAHCSQPDISGSVLFCAACQNKLGLRQAKPLEYGPSYECHAAAYFNASTKRLLYGYKFYNRTESAGELSALLTQYWTALSNSDYQNVHPENVLVLSIPPHTGSPDRVGAFARRFARHFGYDYQDDVLGWQREIAPQHSLHEKQARLNNIALSMQARPLPLPTYARVILIDDLTTTGATLREACRALWHAGVSLEIVGLAVAKVPLGDPQYKASRF